MTSRVPPELITGASRCLYACRAWEKSHGGAAMQMSCADCGAKIAVTPSVLAGARRRVHDLGRSLAVVCDECAIQAGVDAGAMVATLATDR